jgi:hypothetical protein
MRTGMSLPLLRYATSRPGASQADKELHLRGWPWWVGSRNGEVGRQGSMGLTSARIDWRVGYARGLAFATSRSAPDEFRVRWSACSELQIKHQSESGVDVGHETRRDPSYSL